ncbi:ATRNL1 isoform 8 [Pan troglodytes]|uniref:ATRNL1 isoform 8 n=1 Tax=Pan troglodytes TaxID=9598 RepID=A0A2J8PC92_PANTR|nr:ATRNL1 isoform 8 [Pan troglodytes]
MPECDWRQPSGGDGGWDLSLLTGERDWDGRRDFARE